jgi:hypothetical protein
MDELRRNVVPHRPTQEQLLVDSMESTGQYHKPVWLQLEGRFQLHLAQAHSNRGPKGRKRDFADAVRMVRRFLSDDLILSYVPGMEQRLWRRLNYPRLEAEGFRCCRLEIDCRRLSVPLLVLQYIRGSFHR